MNEIWYSILPRQHIVFTWQTIQGVDMGNEKPVALITGANQGFTVLIGSRNFARREDAMKSIDGACAIQLDVTDQDSIRALSAPCARTRIQLSTGMKVPRLWRRVPPRQFE